MVRRKVREDLMCYGYGEKETRGKVREQVICNGYGKKENSQKVREGLVFRGENGKRGGGGRNGGCNVCWLWLEGKERESKEGCNVQQLR